MFWRKTLFGDSKYGSWLYTVKLCEIFKWRDTIKSSQMKNYNMDDNIYLLLLTLAF